MNATQAHFTHADFPKPAVEQQSVVSRFEAQVSRYPDRVAVKTTTQTLTYSQLNHAANRLARFIIAKRGLGAEPIALMFGLEAQVIVALLAVLKAGKGYVALNPRYTAPMLTYVLNNAQPSLIISDSYHLPRLTSLSHTQAELINVYELDLPYTTDNLELVIAPDNLAGIFYTSGSTGQPKGIERHHRHLMHSTWHNTNEYGITAKDRHSLLFSCGFTASVPDVFDPLLNGASLHPFDASATNTDQLIYWLQKDEITLFHPPVPLLRQLLATLLEQPTHLPQLRTIFLGGQPIYKEDVTRFQRLFTPTCKILYKLVMTEASLLTHFWIDHQTQLDGNSVPIGHPTADKEILWLDETGQPVPPGEMGEIAVRSRYLSPGYWNNPDLTRQKFLPDPDGGDERIYLTGDLGRLRPDGQLEILGRKDFMVKIRGYRVELGAIEAALHNLETVKTAVVVAQDSAQGEKRLVAYIVPQTQPPLSVTELRRNLALHLPDYMLPAVFVTLDDLPLTPNGKIDRKALPPPSSTRPNLEPQYVAPRTNLERTLVDLWKSLFQLDKIGIHDNFFDLGGQSLLLTQLAVKLQRTLHVNLTMVQLLQNPTIASLANAITTAPSLSTSKLLSEQESNLICLQPNGDQTPLFFIPGGGGGEYEFVIYGRLTRLLGLDRPVYGFLAQGLTGKPDHPDVTTMARDYVTEMRRRQPAGPYLLIADCVGGKVAWEMAHEIQQQGQTVGLLAMLNTKAVHIPHHPNQYRNQTGLPFWWERIAVHLHQLLKPDPYFAENRLAYIKGRVDTLLSLLHPLTDHQRRMRRVREARAHYSRLLLNHRPTRPYSGRMVILATADHYHDNPTLGWQDWVTGELQLYPMPGQRNTYLQDHTELIVEQLRSCFVQSKVNLRSYAD